MSGVSYCNRVWEGERFYIFWLPFFRCLSVCWFHIGFYTVIITYTYYIWFEAEFFGTGSYLYFRSVGRQVQTFWAKMYLLLCLNTPFFTISIDVANAM